MSYSDIDRSIYTPMMQQYLDIKKDYVDTLVFFRLGDFYEMFFDDAILASRELEIALTGKDAGAKERVPMCGVPHHAANIYIEKLIEKGYKVAIVEQTEDPSKAKGIVKRDVVRLITPGTIIEDGSLSDKENNYIVSVTESKAGYILVYCDFSTGESYLTNLPNDQTYLANEILSLKTREVIVSKRFNLKSIEVLQKNYQILFSFEDMTDIPEKLNHLCHNINIEEQRVAFGRLLNYIIRTQKREMNHFQVLNVYDSKQFLRMDIHSRRNLELTETLRTGQKKGSLLSVIDKTTTAMGSRELKKWLDRPLIDAKQIQKRLDTVEVFIKNYLVREDIKECLKTVYDLERIVGRISYGNANAKDLVQLRRTLEHLPKIKAILHSVKNPLLSDLGDQIIDFKELHKLLEDSIVDNPPLTIKEGGIIKHSFSEELAKLYDASKNGKNWMQNFEKNEREKTGIKNLKVGYNRVFGYYIEVSKVGLDQITDDLGYIRKQTIANGERFITPLLKEMESLILGSSEKAISLEYELFIEIRDKVSSYANSLQDLARVISYIDVFISLADVSEKNHYVKPEISNDNTVNIINGRHPVIETLLDTKFIANDIIINKYNTILITGPNMSGKSTYMRQFAVTIILMQIGCFVPADTALLPVYDQIFTRIGASDDLVSGQSTFMVEMMETNNAIKNATKKSLILFDEIGRGTATYDGMALAQSIIEYVHEKIGCTTLFSTHYHELISLEKTLKRLKNVHVTAKEEHGGVIFLHKVEDGPTDKSFGINVASLAHLPKPLIERSKQLLEHYEQTKGKEEIAVDLFNFDDYHEEITEDYAWLRDMINDVDLNTLTPLDAINFLASVKEKIK